MEGLWDIDLEQLRVIQFIDGANVMRGKGNQQGATTIHGDNSYNNTLVLRSMLF